jgi:hypothetical protein
MYMDIYMHGLAALWALGNSSLTPPQFVYVLTSVNIGEIHPIHYLSSLIYSSISSLSDGYNTRSPRVYSPWIIPYQQVVMHISSKLVVRVMNVLGACIHYIRMRIILKRRQIWGLHMIYLKLIHQRQPHQMCTRVPPLQQHQRMVINERLIIRVNHRIAGAVVLHYNLNYNNNT